MDSPWVQGIVLCLCAAAAGSINAVAGGGTLLTFPALLAFLGPNGGVVANATSTVALFPASVSGIWAYRDDHRPLRRWLMLLAAPSFLGGLVGALLLTRLPKEYFAAAVPWLILTAAVLFALQPVISRWCGIGKAHQPPRGPGLAAVLLFQFGVAVYGGYFGAGIGILMLSSMALMGLDDIHAMNGLKCILGSCINGVAIVIFIVERQVHWPLAALMCLSASFAQYSTARFARKLNRDLVRWCVIVIGFALAGYYFCERLLMPQPSAMHPRVGIAAVDDERFLLR